MLHTVNALLVADRASATVLNTNHSQWTNNFSCSGPQFKYTTIASHVGHVALILQRSPSVIGDKTMAC